jgi:CubicO group peptidase (beta-lactamase class C family)
MTFTKTAGWLWIAALLVVFGNLGAAAQETSGIDPQLSQKIDEAVQQVLTSTGAPGVSLAIVKDNKIAYLHAYGKAKLDPVTPAQTDLRYSIGSVSKQITASLMLLLHQEGKLSLEDKVSKYFPNLTRANEVTIRELLSHTSGYQDYWPQDYVPPFMLKPVTPAEIMQRWAGKPLDFDPGTKWQYSNTNFVIAGAIAEKVTGKPFFELLKEKIFDPLGMKTVTDANPGFLPTLAPVGYVRYGLGPLRPAPELGKGWLFSAGQLAMTAEDLARWDLSIINQKLLSPASYKQLETETLLKSGAGSQYGLGISVLMQNERRVLVHNGGVSGFTSQNMIFPDDHVAIVSLVNEDSSSAPGEIVGKILPMIFDVADPATPAKLEQAKKIFAGLQKGTIDRSLFTDNANSYFDEQNLKDFAAGLGPLGDPTDFVQVHQEFRGGMTLRIYRVRFAQKTLRAWTYEMPDGKLEQYQVAAVE